MRNKPEFIKNVSRAGLGMAGFALVGGILLDPNEGQSTSTPITQISGSYCVTVPDTSETYRVLEKHGGLAKALILTVTSDGMTISSGDASDGIALSSTGGGDCQKRNVEPQSASDTALAQTLRENKIVTPDQLKNLLK